MRNGNLEFKNRKISYFLLFEEKKSIFKRSYLGFKKREILCFLLLENYWFVKLKGKNRYSRDRIWETEIWNLRIGKFPSKIKKSLFEKDREIWNSKFKFPLLPFLLFFRKLLIREIKRKKSIFERFEKWEFGIWEEGNFMFSSTRREKIAIRERSWNLEFKIQISFFTFLENY